MSDTLSEQNRDYEDDVREVRPRRQLEDKVAGLQQLVCDFQAAAMLGTDPEGVTPAILERHVTGLREELTHFKRLALGRTMERNAANAASFALQGEVEGLRAEVTNLREQLAHLTALADYAEHTPECQEQQPRNAFKCSCGLDELMEE